MVTQLYRERHGALFGLIGAATAAGSVVMLPTSRIALDVSLETALLVLAGTIALALVGVLAFLRVGGRAERSQQAPVSIASVHAPARLLAARRAVLHLRRHVDGRHRHAPRGVHAGLPHRRRHGLDARRDARALQPRRHVRLGAPDRSRQPAPAARRRLPVPRASCCCCCRCCARPSCSPPSR